MSPYKKLSVFVHLSNVEGISSVLLYCLLYRYLLNIKVYDKISPELFLIIHKLHLCVKS